MLSCVSSNEPNSAFLSRTKCNVHCVIDERSLVRGLRRFRIIKSKQRYRITMAQADGLSRTLGSLSRRSGEAHPLIAKAQEDALRSQIEDLQSDLGLRASALLR